MLRPHTSFFLALAFFVVRCGKESGDTIVRQEHRPTLVLSSPDARSIPWGTDVKIHAEVEHAPAGSVVEFRALDTLIVRDAVSPFETVYRPRHPGELVIIAQLRDTRGSVIANDAVTMTVVRPHPVTGTEEMTARDIAVAMAGGEEPWARLTWPRAGTTLDGPAAVRLQAKASGTVARLQRVEFVIDGTVEGTVAYRPARGREQEVTSATETFAFLWDRPAPGTHAIIARAVDVDGRIGSSEPHRIVITKKQAKETPP